MYMRYRIVFIFILTAIISLKAQEEKIIEIRQAGGSKQDQEAFPGANILFKKFRQNESCCFMMGH